MPQDQAQKCCRAEMLPTWKACLAHKPLRTAAGFSSQVRLLVFQARHAVPKRTWGFSRALGWLDGPWRGRPLLWWETGMLLQAQHNTRGAARRTNLCQLGRAVGLKGAEATGVLRVSGVQPPQCVQLRRDVDNARWSLLQGGHIRSTSFWCRSTVPLVHHRAVATAGSRRSSADVDWLPACCSMMGSRSQGASGGPTWMHTTAGDV